MRAIFSFPLSFLYLSGCKWATQRPINVLSRNEMYDAFSFRTGCLLKQTRFCGWKATENALTVSWRTCKCVLFVRRFTHKTLNGAFLCTLKAKIRTSVLSTNPESDVATESTNADAWF